MEAVETHIGEHIVTLGPLIPNRDVVRSLQERGVACIERVEDAPAGAAVVIRSHGAAPEVYDSLKTRGIDYIDATCPFVKRIHERVRAAAEAGQRVIIVGEKGHPEVIGTIGWAGSGAFVVNSEEEVAALPHMDEAVVVAQTTITQEKWEQLLAALKTRVDHIIPFMSICSATQQRRKRRRDRKNRGYHHCWAVQSSNTQHELSEKL